MAVSAKKIAAMYADGLSLRQIGARVGLSHEGVRKVLVANGTPLRVPSAGPGALPDLAKEIAADLPVEFPKGATADLLQDWLGSPRPDIDRALDRLFRDHVIEERYGRIFLAPTPASKPNPGTQLARVLECLEAGPMTTAMVAERIGGAPSSVAATLSNLAGRGLVSSQVLNCHNARSWFLVPARERAA